MIDKDIINQKFKGRQAKPIGKFKKSAVMILLLEKEGELYILFEKRSLNLIRQPGDICLPGGSIEIGESPKGAAIREAEEELNIDKRDIEFIGDMDYFISPYNTIIFPFVGRLHTEKINPNKSEVDYVFKVPLEFFLKKDPIAHQVEVRPYFEEGFPFHIIEGGRGYKFMTKKYNQYFYIYNEYVIWGFTAQIIKSFIDTLKE